MAYQYKKSLFGDVDRDRLSPERDWFFIAERILEFGDIDDLFWLKETFPKEKIKDAVQKSRILSSRTRAYCKVSGYVS